MPIVSVALCFGYDFIIVALLMAYFKAGLRKHGYNVDDISQDQTLCVYMYDPLGQLI